MMTRCPLPSGPTRYPTALQNSISADALAARHTHTQGSDQRKREKPGMCAMCILRAFCRAMDLQCTRDVQWSPHLFLSLTRRRPLLRLPSGSQRGTRKHDRPI